MTEDKRARLEEIKSSPEWVKGPQQFWWLISELEAAWAEVERLKRWNVEYNARIGEEEEFGDEMQARAEAAETQLSVLDGSSCGEEQLDGNGPCGICVFCLRDRAEAAEKRVKRLEEALESLLGISHRIEGCSDSDCLVCRENDRVIEQARAAREEKP